MQKIILGVISITILSLIGCSGFIGQGTASGEGASFPTGMRDIVEADPELSGELNDALNGMSKELRIEFNQLMDLGKSLSENHCINSTIFKMAIYSTFNQYNIKPGLYNLKDVHTNTDIIRLITSNTKDRKRFTIYEGWSIDQIAEKLSGQLSIDKHKFINLTFYLTEAL